MPVTHQDIVKVVVIGNAPDTVIWENVYYWQLDDPDTDSPTNGQIVFALDTKLTAMYNDIAGEMANDYLVDELEVDRIEWNGTIWETMETIGGAPLAVAGGDATDASPQGIAALLTANTEKPKTRARKFFPGIAEDNWTDSILDGGNLTNLAAMAVEWLTDQLVIGTAELVPVVISLAVATEGDVFPLISATANAIAAYQRRRKPGVGA